MINIIKDILLKQRRNKTISIFIPSFEKGGVERNILIVSKMLIKNNIEVDLIYSRNDDELFSQLNEKVNKIKIKRFLNIPIIHPRIIDSLNIVFGYFIYLIKNKKKLIVISFQNNLVAIILCKILNIKIIARVASHPNVANIEKSFVIKMSHKLKGIIYRYATLIITNSEATTKEIRKLTKAKTETIYNPTFDDTILFKSKELVDDDIFNCIKNKKIVAVGRLSFEKDFQTLIKAFKIAKNKIDCSLVFVGEGKELENLQRLVSLLDIEKYVFFLGFKSNPYKYIANCDLLVLSSLYEGLPNVIIESIAIGTPVVATDCLSGPREILLNGKGGDLVEVGNVNQMSDAIIRNLASAEYSNGKLKHAQAHLERFNIDSIYKKYLELINRMSK